MSVPTDNKISVKEYNKISKYIKKEIEQMRHFKTTTIPVSVGSLSMTQKGTDKYIIKIPGSRSQYEIQEKQMYFTWLFISLRFGFFV